METKIENYQVRPESKLDRISIGVVMKLIVESETSREILGKASSFPKTLREALCDSVREISIDNMEALLKKHETNPANFDSLVEKNLRQANDSLDITRNCRISPHRRFNHDLVIKTDDALVCVEIEKGYLARFEFDILKMLAFCSERRQKIDPGVALYGAFIVPGDNVVASHISGNSNESSYRYLKRIAGLVALIQPSLLDDILILGYAVEEPVHKTNRRAKGQDKHKKSGAKEPSQVVQSDGLLSDENLTELRGYPSDLWRYLRERLASRCPNLREKFNPKSRYLGYANKRSDAVYVYIQKQGLRIDLRLAADQADELRSRGFEIRSNDNYQSKSGWLTGLRVPHDTTQQDEIVNLMLEALQVEPP